MDDLGAINRRTNLPIRIIQDRPHQQKRNTSTGRNPRRKKEYEEERETYAIKNYFRDNMLRAEAGKKKTSGTKTRNKQLETAHNQNRRKEKKTKCRIPWPRNDSKHNRHGRGQETKTRTSKQANMEKCRHGNGHSKDNIPGISDKKERQHLCTTDIDMNQEEQTKRSRQIIQNDLEYADDTQLFIEKDTGTNA